jgi:hypothetical protein
MYLESHWNSSSVEIGYEESGAVVAKPLINYLFASHGYVFEGVSR